MRSSNYLRQAKRRHNKSIVDDSTVFTSNDQIIGKDTLASLMDVTITSVERWIRDGMPVEQRGDNSMIGFLILAKSNNGKQTERKQHFG